MKKIKPITTLKKVITTIEFNGEEFDLLSAKGAGKIIEKLNEVIERQNKAR